MTTAPWKLTITANWSRNQTRDTEHYLTVDKRYKSYTRWEHRLKGGECSVISNFKVERTEKFTVAPKDSYTVVLKIRGIAEKTMGTLDCITPVINYNPKAWLGNIKKNDIYVRVYLYEKASGISSTNAYQSAADNYGIFMSELREVWRAQLQQSLIVDSIIKDTEQKIDTNKALHNDQMYELCRKLHKRCKSDLVWNDMQKAFSLSFGPSKNPNQSNQNHQRNNNHNQRNRNVTQTQQFSPSKHYILRQRR